MSRTSDYILNKYGPLLTTDQVAEIFGYETKKGLSGAINEGRVSLHRKNICKYHYMDVAEAVDSMAVTSQV